MSLKGVTLWFTGLSGAGKTTITKLLEVDLKSRGLKVERLDGDVVRTSLTRDLGFSREDRQRNIQRVAFVAKLLTRNQVIVLAALISPYREDRDYARTEIGGFHEVYVRASIETCIQRDVKGMYAKALRGEISNFTGISDPFEEPLSPELVLDTEQATPEECKDLVLAFLEDRGYLTGNGPVVAAGGENVESANPYRQHQRSKT